MKLTEAEYCWWATMLRQKYGISQPIEDNHEEEELTECLELQ